MTEAQKIARRVRIAYDRFHRTGNAAPLVPLRAEVNREIELAEPAARHSAHSAISREITTTRNYNAPTVDAEWAATRETDLAVATAIHAIADSGRDADAIWEAPTAAEWQHVEMAVAEYIAHGDFPANDDGRYAWGQETVTIDA